MKSVYICLLISFVIHFIILILLYTIDTDRISIHHPLEINIQSTISTPQDELKFTDQIHGDISPQKDNDLRGNTRVNLYPFDYHFLLDSLHKPISSSPDSSEILNPKEWEQFLSKALKKDYFLSEINLPTKKDSQLTAFSLQELDLFQIEHDHNYDLGRTNTNDVQPFLSVDKIVSFLREQLDKANPPQFNFIPSEIQLNIIKILSNRGNATQLELYSLMSQNQPFTIEMLNHDLDLLTDKGFLKREKISPEHLFNLFGIPIEMSRKNKLNPVYRYDLNINKQELLSYLQSKYFLLEQELQTDPSDSSTIISEMKILQEKILLLFQ